MANSRDIADKLRRDIADGTVPVGSELPGIWILRQRYQASPHTVRRAEQILVDEGLLRIEQGRSTVVIAAPPHDEPTLDELWSAHEAALQNALVTAQELRKRLAG